MDEHCSPATACIEPGCANPVTLLLQLERNKSVLSLQHTQVIWDIYRVDGVVRNVPSGQESFAFPHQSKSQSGAAVTTRTVNAIE
eukprot:1434353-Rhodomonas_salina.1